MIYDCQSLQLRNNGLELRGVGDRQPLQNIIVIILYHIQFNMAHPFNRSSVYNYILDCAILQ
jgi:hypothetical protein